jgi:hypothetical protein
VPRVSICGGHNGIWCSNKVQQPRQPTVTSAALPRTNDLHQRPMMTFLPLAGKEVSGTAEEYSNAIGRQ